jgi:hypothetical protein
VAIQYPEILDKLLDNANVGKVVTDVGSGFTLSLSVLMLVGVSTNLSVVPADRIRELSQEIAVQEKALEEQTEAFRPILSCSRSYPLREPAAGVGDPCQGRVAAAALEGDLYFLARREIARLAAEIESLGEVIDARVKKGMVGREDLHDLAREKADLAAVADRLVSQRESVDEQRERLDSLRNALTDARSLELNIASLSRHVSGVLALSVVLGVVLSQISRLVFVRWLYDRILARRGQRAPAGMLSDENRERLVTNYYRYVEGSINMVFPVLAFGLVFPRYANGRLDVTGPVSALAWGLGGLVVAGLLVWSGFSTYRSFREKERELAGAADRPR